MSAVLQYDANQANNKPINKIIIMHCYITDAVANDNGSYIYLFRKIEQKNIRKETQ